VNQILVISLTLLLFTALPAQGDCWEEYQSKIDSCINKYGDWDGDELISGGECIVDCDDDAERRVRLGVPSSVIKNALKKCYERCKKRSKSCTSSAYNDYNDCRDSEEEPEDPEDEEQQQCEEMGCTWNSGSCDCDEDEEDGCTYGLIGGNPDTPIKRE